MKLTVELLENKFREFIFIFLEMVTFRLIWALGEIENQLIKNNIEKSVEVNQSTQIISFNNNLEELVSNKSISKICQSLDFFNHVIASKITINDSYISHSKLNGKDIETVIEKLTPTKIKLIKNIQQEWGGSKWEIEFYTDEKSNEFIYCEETSKFQIKMLFNGKKDF